MGTKFESLLEDKSYVTIENALIKLWSNFPEKRIEYLNKTSKVIGLPDKNVRLLWLTLALITEEYNPKLKESYFKELNSYTDSNNHFEVRQLAFQYLIQIQALNDFALINLVKATQHHAWQFKKVSKNLLKKVIENNTIKERLLKISTTLSDKEKNTLNQLINQ